MMHIKAGTVFRLLSLLCLALVGTFAIHVSPASAQQTACDPEYMDALESRAWLEMQREIEQNQNLIYKPDSVLEYTCFNSFLNEMAAGPNFSETNKWVSGDASALDSALTQIAGTAAATYVNTNFSHSTLGGKISYSPAFSGSVSGAAYTCNVMNTVWSSARCGNFLEGQSSQKNQDGFYDFFWYASNDPRKQPANLQACTNPIKASALNAAFNNKAAQHVLPAGSEKTSTPNDGTAYKEDAVVTHLDLIKPGTCSGDPIPTGVTVKRKGGDEYEEHVCPNPGCYYNGSSCAK